MVMDKYDSPEFAERRKKTVERILADAIVALGAGRYADARDSAATAASSIDIEFVQERSRLKGLPR